MSLVGTKYETLDVTPQPDNQNNHHVWGNTRPIIIIADGNDNHATELLLRVFEKLNDWNPGKDALMVSVIKYDGFAGLANDIYIYANSSIGFSAFDIEEAKAFVSGDLSRALEYDDHKLIFNMQDLNKQRVKIFLTENLLGVEHFRVNYALEKSYVSEADETDGCTNGLRTTLEVFFDVCEGERTWLPPCIIFFSKDESDKLLRDALFVWKNSSKATFQIFALGKNLTYDWETTFPEENIESLAKSVMGFADPKPVITVKKRSVENLLQIHLPALEGALYDND